MDLIFSNKYGPWLSTQDGAIRSGSKYYFTAEPCKRGHVAPRKGSNRVCSSCIAVTQSKASIEKYLRSDKGREKNRKNQAALRATENGLAAEKRRAANYRKTEQGRQRAREAKCRFAQKRRDAEHFSYFMEQMQLEADAL